MILNSAILKLRLATPQADRTGLSEYPSILREAYQTLDYYTATRIQYSNAQHELQGKIITSIDTN